MTVIHSTDCVQPPAMTFVTHLFNGEHIRQMSSTILHDKNRDSKSMICRDR